METSFTPINTTAEFDDLLTRSQEQPVVLFKHDYACSISAGAYREMSRLNDQDVWLVDVADAKPLAAEIAERTGVRHESPQVIVLSGGRVAWDASHMDITAEGVSRALQGTA